MLTAPVDDGLTLIDKRHGTLYHLNNTGAVILAALINNGGAVESTIATLVGRYDINEDQARADVTTLVENLRARGLVVSR